MAELKSIEKLRAFADERWDPWPESQKHIHKVLDEVQAEVDSRFMELPVDADGEPIHVDDLMRVDGEVVTVDAIGRGVFVSRLVSMNPLVSLPRAYRHYRKPTVEDVLRDYRNALDENGASGVRCVEDIDAEYAEWIREVLS